MGASILIVEDEEPLTTLLRYNLEAEGYEVDAVARGDEADTRLRETAPDLVVLYHQQDVPGLAFRQRQRRRDCHPNRWNHRRRLTCRPDETALGHALASE